jgi:hypothetical protein
MEISLTHPIAELVERMQDAVNSLAARQEARAMGTK